MKNIYDTYTLNNGVKIPCIAYGTYKAKDENGADIITAAVEEGYRYFDTASYYQTEEYVAEAIRRSGLPREDFFIATKLWKDQMGYMPYSWLPHSTLAKHLSKEQLTTAFQVMQNQFGPFSGEVTKISLAKTNPYTDLEVIDFLQD